MIAGPLTLTSPQEPSQALSISVYCSFNFRKPKNSDQTIQSRNIMQPQAWLSKLQKGIPATPTLKNIDTNNFGFHGCYFSS